MCLHIWDLFMKNNETNSVKRTQRDYTLGFKLSIVEQVEKATLLTKKHKNITAFKVEVPY